MGIQRCKKCGTKFNYMDVLDSVGWGYKPLSCRNCGAQHNLKMLYIFILAILLTLPMFFIGQIRNYILTMSLNMVLVVLFYIIYIAIIAGLYPFIIKYSFKEDKNLNY
ncbi:MAG: TIGR04104 family putative zinc finger protein [Senegalia sp. (in: firmicutes)]